MPIYQRTKVFLAGVNLEGDLPFGCDVFSTCDLVKTLIVSRKAVLINKLKLIYKCIYLSFRYIFISKIINLKIYRHAFRFFIIPNWVLLFTKALKGALYWSKVKWQIFADLPIICIDIRYQCASYLRDLPHAPLYLRSGTVDSVAYPWIAIPHSLNQN